MSLLVKNSGAVDITLAAGSPSPTVRAGTVMNLDGYEIDNTLAQWAALEMQRVTVQVLTYQWLGVPSYSTGSLQVQTTGPGPQGAPGNPGMPGKSGGTIITQQIAAQEDADLLRQLPIGMVPGYFGGEDEIVVYDKVVAPFIITSAHVNIRQAVKDAQVYLCCLPAGQMPLSEKFDCSVTATIFETVPFTHDRTVEVGHSLYLYRSNDQVAGTFYMTYQKL